LIALPHPGDNLVVDVKPIPGQEHLPWAEVWFERIDDELWREASRAAVAIGKSGLEAWTTDETPDVITYLAERGYEEVRRYVRSELDVSAAPDPEPPGMELTTIAERPELAQELYEVVCEAYPDQPGRGDSSFGGYENWRAHALDPHPPETYFLALDRGRVVGFAFLEVDGDVATHGFTGVARAARGRGVATALKRAHIAWAKANGIRTLRTVNETRIGAIRRLNERYGYRPGTSEVVLRGPLAPGVD
jgi:mycothiol synthase